VEPGLILIELTVVLFGWTFDPVFNFFVLQVIWAIGWSMIVLAGLIHLPRAVIATLALAMIAGHNLLEGIEANQFQDFSWLWLLLHQPGFLSPASGVKVFAMYPLIPWIGVMAAGYAFGPVMLLPERQRRSWLLGSGVLLVGVFVGLRAVNVYGDPAPWLAQQGSVASFLSFINCEKYPPSLLYLSMTLGPALIALGVLERVRGKVSQWLITFGRVPFLYYVAHIYLIHLLAVAAAVAVGGDLGWLFQSVSAMNRPPDYGVTLPVVYALWLAIVLSLYPLCHWFAMLKQRRNDWWLSYL
jgi:uncharacterized membrane protein